MDSEKIVVLSTKTGEVLNNYIAIPGDLCSGMGRKRMERRVINFVQIECPQEGYFENLSNQSLARLIYLATYLRYDGRLYKKGLDDFMTLASKQTCCNTLREFVKTGYLKKGSDGYEIISPLLFRGKKRTKHRHFVKVSLTPYRNLMKSTPPSSQTYIGYLIRLLPYFSLTTGDICENPLEAEDCRIKPLTMEEICDKLGYSKIHAIVLLKEFLKLEADVDGVKQKIVAVTNNEKSALSTIALNPDIFIARCLD